MIGRIGRWFRRQRDWMAIEDGLRADIAELRALRAYLEGGLLEQTRAYGEAIRETHRLQEDLDSAGRVTAAHQKAAEEREQEIGRLERRIASLEGLLADKERRFAEIAAARSPAFAPWARPSDGEV